MKTIYYRIADGVHYGEVAFLELVPGGNSLGSAGLANAGWIKKSDIPDHWNIHCRYRNGQLIVRPDAPPYWDELGSGLITNSLFQRLQVTRYSQPAVNVSMIQISEVIGIGKNEISLAYTLVGLRSILDSLNIPITPAEITEAEALLVSCGFQPNFFTYAENVVNPPSPPPIA